MKVVLKLGTIMEWKWDRCCGHHSSRTIQERKPCNGRSVLLGKTIFILKARRIQKYLNKK